MAPKAAPPVAKPISLSRDDDEDESEDVAEEEEEEDESEDTGEEEAGVNKKEESSEDGSEDEEDESNDEGQQSQNPPKPKKGKLATRSVEKKPALKKPAELEPDSDSDSHSGSFQSQPSPDASNFTIKPISPAAGAKASSSKKLPLSSPPPPKSSKSPASLFEAEPPKGSDPGNRMKKKRKKPSVGHDATEKSKKVWGEDDEIAVLIGLNDFRTNKGANPHDDTAAPYDFLMTYLHNGFSKAQVTNKIKRLKKKFLGNAERLQSGGGPLLSRPHERKVFELGKKIWGLERCNRKEKKGSEKDSKKEKTDVGSMENGVAEVKGGDAEKFWCELPWLKASIGFLNKPCRGVAMEKMNLIAREKARELDERWRKVRAAEMETELDKISLLSEQTKLVLDMLKSSGP